jgi:hypothetical protein
MRQNLFRIWLTVTIAYLVSAGAYEFFYGRPGLHPWLSHALGGVFALGLPLLALTLGYVALWIVEHFAEALRNSA